MGLVIPVPERWRQKDCAFGAILVRSKLGYVGRPGGGGAGRWWVGLAHTRITSTKEPGAGWAHLLWLSVVVVFLNMISMFVSFVKNICSLTYFCIFQARRILFAVDCYSLCVHLREWGLEGVCVCIFQAFRSLVCLGSKGQIWVLLRIEPRASNILGKYSITELYPRPLWASSCSSWDIYIYIIGLEISDLYVGFPGLYGCWCVLKDIPHGESPNLFADVGLRA